MVEQDWFQKTMWNSSNPNRTKKHIVDQAGLDCTKFPYHRFTWTRCYWLLYWLNWRKETGPNKTISKGNNTGSIVDFILNCTRKRERKNFSAVIGLCLPYGEDSVNVCVSVVWITWGLDQIILSELISFRWVWPIIFLSVWFITPIWTAAASSLPVFIW